MKALLSQEVTKHIEHFAERCLNYCLKNKIRIDIPENVHEDWEGIMGKSLDAKRNKIPKGSSIYILFGSDGQMLYVGKSNNTYTRLRGHLVKKNNRTNSKFSEFIKYVDEGNRSIFFAAIAIKPKGLNAFCEIYLQENHSFSWVHRKG